MFTVQVTTNVHLAKALGRGGRYLIERATDVDRFIAVVNTRFDGIRLDSRAILPQCLYVFLGERAVSVSEQSYRRALRRLRSMVTWR